MKGRKGALTAANAFRFVLVLGIVNLFADVTYEGASSINGQFLGMLGASAAAIGAIAGISEFLGYSLRFVAGYISDRTGKYWLVTFVGYAINLLAVPALALAGSWQTAAVLVVAERVGRAIRKPPSKRCCPTRPARSAKAACTRSTTRSIRPAARSGRC